ncbi:MAG: YkuS family protein [Tuberibacillus sp.]
MVKVAVEESLTNVSEALKAKGYNVVTLKNESDAKDCDCCVVTGQDVNVMGIQDVVTQGSVIDARGMSAEDICKEVEERIKH